VNDVNAGVLVLRRMIPAAVLLLASGGCAAHLPAPGERVAFLERSSIAVASDREQLYEADPALHLMLWNGLEDSSILAAGGFATSGSISFLGSFRLLRGASAPIRVPTYEPRLRLQLFRGAVLRPGGEDEASPRAHLLLGALEVSVGHRSNGQNGCALADHVRYGSSDFDCAPTTALPSARLNVVDGSFTTNYVGVGLSGLWASPGSGGGAPPVVLTATSSIEWNFACGLGACMPVEMRDRYGVALARGSLAAEARPWNPTIAGRRLGLGLRATLAGSAHLAAAGRAPFGDASAELALVSRPRHGLATSLFVRRHQGRDPLNIRFEERLDAWILGVGLEPSPIASGPRPAGS
jgi:hypothetical protein